ncbi:hypothetical protein K8089_14875 [Aequorivita sp. F47161]|uniref:Uncharacterized protein n=1 Tax=Aequorivita vitellina TaxID=2874475 RepID=A0A9X1QWM5_9FLAO|nr:hypothetical protein [Aequorivita vitellina]MCG2420308.1 hypothetical protein [Aequorivita vitellina]
MIQLVSEYSNYLKQLPVLIKNSPYKAAYIIDKLQMPKPTYYRKLKDNSFTVAEVKKLTEILFSKEAYLKEIKETIARSREEIKNGKSTEHKILMDDIRNEFL